MRNATPPFQETRDAVLRYDGRAARSLRNISRSLRRLKSGIPTSPFRACSPTSGASSASCLRRTRSATLLAARPGTGTERDLPLATTVPRAVGREVYSDENPMARSRTDVPPNRRTQRSARYVGEITRQQDPHRCVRLDDGHPRIWLHVAGPRVPHEITDRQLFAAAWNSARWVSTRESKGASIMQWTRTTVSISRSWTFSWPRMVNCVKDVSEFTSAGSLATR